MQALLAESLLLPATTTAAQTQLRPGSSSGSSGLSGTVTPWEIGLWSVIVAGNARTGAVGTMYHPDSLTN